MHFYIGQSMKKKHIFYGIAQAVPSKIELSFQQDVLEKRN